MSIVRFSICCLVLKKVDTLGRLKMEKRKTTIRYSNCFKLQVIKKLEERGLNFAECRLKYGIRGADTIQNWLKKYGKNR